LNVAAKNPELSEIIMKINDLRGFDREHAVCNGGRAKLQMNREERASGAVAKSA
jgi:hypothetical protein